MLARVSSPYRGWGMWVSRSTRLAGHRMGSGCHGIWWDIRVLSRVFVICEGKACEDCLAWI